MMKRRPNIVTDSTFADTIRYPFVEADGEHLKFPKHQLYRQNSKIAVLVVDPSHVTVQVTRSKIQKLLKKNASTMTDAKYQSALLPSCDCQESIETPTPKLNGEQQKHVKVNAEVKLSSAGNLAEHTKRHVLKSSVDLSTVDEDINSKIEDGNEMQLVGQNLLQISKGVDFLMCDVATVCLLLSDDQLQVSNESVVFRAAYRWLKFRLTARLVYGSQIMKSVRFGLMKPRDLVKCFVRGQSLGLLDSSDFCEQLFVGLLWSLACKYDLAHLIDELKPKKRKPNTSDNYISDEPVFSSGFSSRTSLISYHSSMTDVKISDKIISKIKNKS